MIIKFHIKFAASLFVLLLRCDANLFLTIQDLFKQCIDDHLRHLNGINAVWMLGILYLKPNRGNQALLRIFPETRKILAGFANWLLLLTCYIRAN